MSSPADKKESATSVQAQGGTGMFQDRPPLPSNRAFAIQLHAEAQVEQDQWHGRVEPKHVGINSAV
jgi:hypothetical protein